MHQPPSTIQQSDLGSLAPLGRKQSFTEGHGSPHSPWRLKPQCELPGVTGAYGFSICHLCHVRKVVTGISGRVSWARACCSPQHCLNRTQAGALELAPGAHSHGEKDVLSWFWLGSVHHPFESRQGGSENTLRPKNHPGIYREHKH